MAYNNKSLHLACTTRALGVSKGVLPCTTIFTPALRPPEQLPSGMLLVTMAGEKGNMKKCALALKMYARGAPPELLLTFQWPEQVPW